MNKPHLHTWIQYLLLVLFVLLSFLTAVTPVSAQATTTIELYWGEGCPHCEKAKPFLEKLSTENEDIKLKTYEIYNNQANQEKFVNRARELGAQNFGVPFTVIGDEYVVGFASAETTGKKLKKLIEEAQAPQQDQTKPTPEPQKETINVPLLQDIDPENVSLPVLAIVLGIVDGFNPCAMWALLFIIGLLVNLQDRRKLVILGSTFILTSGLVYFLFMSAWLNVFLLVGYLDMIRFLVGTAAIAIAGYNFYDFWKNRRGGCEKVDKAKRSKTFTKAKAIINSRNLMFAIAGIIVLAVSVNMIELACSAGLPAIFTHVLTLNELPTLQYYLYMLLYILFFMIDDLIIFFGAVFTFRVLGISNKYARASRLIGGVIMLIIGILLLLRPELLMFG